MFLKRLFILLPTLFISMDANSGPIGRYVVVNWVGTKIANAGPGTCGPETISFHGSQDPNDDEFLYSDKENFDAACAAYKNTNKTNSGTGHAYECDNKHCKMNQIITMPSGHVFKGQVINREVKYQCSDPFLWADKWIPVDNGTCYAGREFGTINVGQWTKRTLTKTECSGFELTDDNGTAYRLLCREGPYLICKAVECKPGYTLDANAGKCIIDNKPQPNPDPTPDPVVKKNCRDSRTSLEGKACCDLPLADAKWTGNTCVCQNPNTEFRIEHGRGVCANKTSPIVKPQCNCSGNITIISNATAACGNNNSAVSEAIAKINTECNRGENCDANVFEWNINIIQNATATCTAQQNAQEQQTQSDTLKRITNAVSTIDKYVDGLDVSVWKNANGEFNTARLASDSIAGVVLGTAGGIITSNVVKKNQLKSGFEDIVCTINGHDVGSYGDEIIVGVQ